MNDEKIISNRFANTKTFWQKSFQTFKGIQPQALYISILGFILPQICFEMSFAGKSALVVERFKETLKPAAVDLEKAGNGFFALLSLTSDFIIQFVISASLLSFFYMVVYCSLIHMATNFSKGKPVGLFYKAFYWSLRKSSFKSALALILVFMVSVLGQLVFPPFILLLIPCVIIPVLIEAEQVGAFKSIRLSFNFRYAKDFVGGSWGVLFHLVSMVAIFYLTFEAIWLLTQYILELDRFIDVPANIWNSPFYGLPFTKIYFLVFIVRLILFSFLINLFAVFTTSLYFWILAIRNALPEEGIVV